MIEKPPSLSQPFEEAAEAEWGTSRAAASSAPPSRAVVLGAMPCRHDLRHATSRRCDHGPMRTRTIWIVTIVAALPFVPWFALAARLGDPRAFVATRGRCRRAPLDTLTDAASPPVTGTAAGRSVGRADLRSRPGSAPARRPRRRGRSRPRSARARARRSSGSSSMISRACRRARSSSSRSSGRRANLNACMPDWRTPSISPSPRSSRSISARRKPSECWAIACSRRDSLGPKSRHTESYCPRPIRPRSWWSWLRP